MAEYELNWTTGRLALVKKCITENIDFLMSGVKKVNFSEFIKIDIRGNSKAKKHEFNEKSMFFELNDAKHSPSSSSLARPPADFWGPRASA